MEIFNRFIAPKGFKFSAVNCGIKQKELDLALIFSDQPCESAAAYTTNVAAAAPIKVSKEHQKAKMTEAIVVNSGNANAATGKNGPKDAYEMAKIAGKSLGVEEKAVLVASTGIIGVPLPIDKVKAGIEKAANKLNHNDGPKVAEAIMTTDTKVKHVSVQFELDSQLITVSGIAKGSGMIAPQMKINEATMLAFIFTDLKISGKALSNLIEDANERTFNAITVDGDTSTNDMVVVLANSLAENKKVKPGDKDFKVVGEAIETVFKSLANQIIADGEGMSKILEFSVKGAETSEDAQKIVTTCSGSSLVKTAFSGNEPNWGRIIAAAGRSGVDFDPEKLKISIEGLDIVKKGIGVDVDKKELTPIMKKKRLHIDIDLMQGSSQAKRTTIDLTSEYVKINEDYS